MNARNRRRVCGTGGVPPAVIPDLTGVMQDRLGVIPSRLQVIPSGARDLQFRQRSQLQIPRLASLARDDTNGVRDDDSWRIWHDGGAGASEKSRVGRGVLLAAGSLAALFSSALGAQEATTTGVRLTLPETIARAERNNPAYRRAVNSLELNAIEEREGWLQLLPRPQLSLLSTSMSWNLQSVGTDPFGNPLPNPEAQMVQSSQSRQQAALGFSFSFSDYVRFRNRAENAPARDATAAGQLQELRADVWRAYLDVQHQELSVALEEELLERQRENREIARRLYALAQRERIDLLEADLEVAVQEEQLRETRASLGAALLRLRKAIGDPALEFAGVEPIDFRAHDPDRLDDESLVRAALDTSPALALQRTEIHRTRQQITETRSQQWLPTLAVNLATSRSELARDGGDAFFSINPSGAWDRNISIGVSFPDIGRYLGNRNSVQSHQVALRNAEETHRQRRMEVEQSVRVTLVELRSAHASVALQERRVALAEERLANRVEAYRLGRGSYPELQTATDAVAAAERALLGARFQLERAWITLEQTVGMPLHERDRDRSAEG